MWPWIIGAVVAELVACALWARWYGRAKPAPIEWSSEPDPAAERELRERVAEAERDLAMERIAKSIVLARYREAAERVRESQMERDVREAVEAAER